MKQKQLPILFSTQMVQAIMAGRKTMTRRIVKPQPNENGISFMKNPPLDWEQIYKEEWKPWKLETEEGESISLKCPYGQPGDILWVRETFAYTQFAFDKSLIGIGEYGIQGSEIYKSDEENSDWDGKWKPSIFMPKDACRTWLEITNVRPERLQDISEEDAISEGIYDGKMHFEELCNIPKNQIASDSKKWFDYFYSKDYRMTKAKHSFETLWQSINGEQSWDANPWVWVISFKQIPKP